MVVGGKVVGKEGGDGSVDCSWWSRATVALSRRISPRRRWMGGARLCKWGGVPWRRLGLLRRLAGRLQRCRGMGKRGGDLGSKAER